MSTGLDAALRLMRAQAALVKRFDARLSGLHGVSLADFTLLLRLSQAPGDRMRRVDLAEALGLTASGVTRGLVPWSASDSYDATPTRGTPASPTRR